jgi:16S rRNA processing protein RimM
MKYVPIGKIISTHGIKGEIKFHYYNEEKEVLSMYTSFFIHENAGWRRLKPTGINLRKGFFCINFDGLDKPEDVAFLINKELFVKEEDLPQLDENEYYEYQLLGLAVFDQKDAALGKVVQIIHTGANDVILVKGEKETLIPMIEGYIQEIDIEHAFIKLTDLFTEFPGN